MISDIRHLQCHAFQRFFCVVSSHSQFQKGAESLPQRRDWQGHCRHTATEPRAALFHGLFGMMVLLRFGRWTCWNSSSLSRATSSWQQHSSWQAAEKLMLRPQCGSELLNLTSSQTTEVLPSWPTSWFQSVLFRGLVNCKIDLIVWYIYIVDISYLMISCFSGCRVFWVSNSFSNRPIGDPVWDPENRHGWWHAAIPHLPGGGWEAAEELGWIQTARTATRRGISQEQAPVLQRILGRFQRPGMFFSTALSVLVGMNPESTD